MIIKADENEDTHWLYPKNRLETLILKLDEYSDNEINSALDYRRSILEFNEDSLSTLERLNNQVMFLNNKYNKLIDGVA